MPLVQLQPALIDRLKGSWNTRSFGPIGVPQIKALASRLWMECFEDSSMSSAVDPTAAHSADKQFRRITVSIAGKLAVIDLAIDQPIDECSMLGTKIADIKLLIADHSGQQHQNFQGTERILLQTLTNSDSNWPNAREQSNNRITTDNELPVLLLDDFAKRIRQIATIDKLSHPPDINWFDYLINIHDALATLQKQQERQDVTKISQLTWGSAIPHSLEIVYWRSHENIAGYPSQTFTFELGVVPAVQQLKMPLQTRWLDDDFEWIASVEHDSSVSLIIYLDPPVLMTHAAAAELELRTDSVCSGREVGFLRAAVGQDNLNLVRKIAGGAYSVFTRVAAINDDKSIKADSTATEAAASGDVSGTAVSAIQIGHPSSISKVLTHLRRSIAVTLLLSSVKQASFVPSMISPPSDNKRSETSSSKPLNGTKLHSIEATVEFASNTNAERLCVRARNDAAPGIELEIAIPERYPYIQLEHIQKIQKGDGSSTKVVESAQIDEQVSSSTIDDDGLFEDRDDHEIHDDDSLLENANEILQRCQDLAVFLARYFQSTNKDSNNVDM